MTLDGTLSIAAGGLATINRQMAVVSQNVANASTPGYSTEVSTQQSLTAGGEGLGVRSGPAIRTIDTALQAEVSSQNATVAGCLAGASEFCALVPPAPAGMGPKWVASHFW
jgi:flagellar hook-associated protein 1 FlgK